MLRIYTRCIERIEKYKDQLEEYFDVPSEKVNGNTKKTLHFSAEPTEMLGILECQFQYKECARFTGEIPGLNKDVESHIYSYFSTNKRITFRIDCTNTFPLLPPKFHLKETNSKALSEALETAQCKFNRDDWSPAFGLDGTLLYLLTYFVKVTKFDED
jgi:hypothetical protein